MGKPTYRYPAPGAFELFPATITSPLTQKPYVPERLFAILLVTRKRPLGVGLLGSPMAVAVTRRGLLPSMT